MARASSETSCRLQWQAGCARASIDRCGGVIALQIAHQRGDLEHVAGGETLPVALVLAVHAFGSSPGSH